MPSSANSGSSSKRKSTPAAKTSSKKGKGVDPASMIKKFDTTYGRIMFGEEGINQLTPADSRRCGMLTQKQQWLLDKADSIGLQDTFEFTQPFVNGLQKDEADIKKQGDDIEYAPLEVFVNLIDAVGFFFAISIIDLTQRGSWA
jgi:hypothetical protein